MKKCKSYKIKRIFSFNRIVGYATIIGSIATLYGIKKIYSLTVELKPVIEIIQKERAQSQNISRDTIMIIHRDTVILRDTVSLSFRDSMLMHEDPKWCIINTKEMKFRRRHQLP